MKNVWKESVSLENQITLNRRTFKAVRWERRLMFFATLATVIGMFIFLSTMVTNYWVIIHINGNGPSSVKISLGVWGEWQESSNSTHKKKRWLSHFPEPPEDSIRLADDVLPHFYRSQAAFGILGLLLMAVSNATAIYTFVNNRYAYKRLVAGLLFVSAMCVVIVIEVLVYSIDEWHIVAKTVDPYMSFMEIIGFEDYKQDKIEKFDVTYGYSLVASWFVVGIYLLTAIIYIIASRKRKGSRAATIEFEFDDRPVNISR